MPRQEPPEPTRSELAEELNDKLDGITHLLDQAFELFAEADELFADLDMAQADLAKQVRKGWELVNLGRSHVHIRDRS